ncbi:unnamed protein product [Microthlaspi erraticum]|uniref:Uncharacterized protein n=1 Tax=Microthlaspi erraticum TaxID=1685480 RepID=A0A6D2KR52_9BRAS|nr:unnamed protein product [Microthlaspi erraticum]
MLLSLVAGYVLSSSLILQESHLLVRTTFFFGGSELEISFSPSVYSPSRRKSTHAKTILKSMEASKVPKRYQVALLIGGLYICGKVGWESVMRMGICTRELFFYETIKYMYPPPCCYTLDSSMKLQYIKDET